MTAAVDFSLAVRITVAKGISLHHLPPRHTPLDARLQGCRQLQKFLRASRQHGCTTFRTRTEGCQFKGHRAKPFMHVHVWRHPGTSLAARFNAPVNVPRLQHQELVLTKPSPFVTRHCRRTLKHDYHTHTPASSIAPLTTAMACPDRARVVVCQTVRARLCLHRSPSTPPAPSQVQH